MNGFSLTPGHILLTLFTLISMFLLSACGGSDGKKISETLPEKPIAGRAGDGTLSDVVNYFRIEAGLPALAAVLVHDGEIIEMSAMGSRSIDNKLAVTIEDKWHLGSLTKSMTSTLAAILVKQGVINWNTTIGDVYPELLGLMKSDYENVRLDQLLSHTSGMRANTPTLDSYYNSSVDIDIQRQKMIEEALLLNPEVTQGEYLYSNLGYMVAGAMMERVTGISWELLLSNNLFNTLGMNDSGFGVPDAQGNLSQPVGHLSQGTGWTPKNNDNPKVLGPAGTVHSSLENMGKYISAHLSGLRGLDVPGLLTAPEFTKLHTASKNGGYGLGWVVTDGALSHNGSNTMWLASINIYPEKNMALFIVTNAADLQRSGNSVAVKAVDKLTKALIKRSDVTFSN
jgi:CubicO group peptidase (beta-lactamase class C family)